MLLRKVYVRHFKSFNFDFERKALASIPEPWEVDDVPWTPFVEVEIEPTITAIVGANESGKSHLLKAIRKAYGDSPIEREDFCRYSTRLSIEVGKEKWPEFGLCFADFEEKVERPELEKLLSLEEKLETLHLFRVNKDTTKVYANRKYIDIDSTKIWNLLPKVFELQRLLKVPDSIPLRLLYSSPQSTISDSVTVAIQQLLLKHSEAILKGDHSAYTQEVAALLVKRKEENVLASDVTTDQIKLMKSLFCDVARISPDQIRDLDAKLAGKHSAGYIEGIFREMNRRLNDALNLPSYWQQDTKFEIRVTRGGADLHFVVRDRTNTDYSFDERSDGLKYFLSYYIQYLAYEQKSKRNEILLMDEPDAYLSALAQQDLLKVFGDFAIPSRPLKPVQVVYVTHSPFLIDRNHPERVKVLDKGSDTDGTRVVAGASNQYEPLRSAFGLAVGESAFVGTSNLIVEGLSDQILLVGISSVLGRENNGENRERLDLNRVTIIAAQGAENVPYSVYLARGRDETKPVVIVLLDRDDDGRLAYKDLSSKNAIIKTYDNNFTSFVREEGPDSTIEDLIPDSILYDAVARVYQALGEPLQFDRATILATIQGAQGTAINRLKSALPGATFSKVALAKEVIALVNDSYSRMALQSDVETLFANFKSLYMRLNGKLEIAEYNNSQARMKDKLRNLRTTFERDHQYKASRIQGLKLLNTYYRILDQSAEATAVRAHLELVKHNFKLDIQTDLDIEDLSLFYTKLAEAEIILNRPATAKAATTVVASISNEDVMVPEKTL